jgi:hypothetical protein
MHRADDARVASVLSGGCMDCGVDTLATGEYYALKDALWRRINPLVIGMLCLTCAEDRLGRSLNGRDFARAPVNAESAMKCPSLARRLTRSSLASSRSMHEIKPRARKIESKRATQSRLGHTSYQLLRHVGRNGRVKPADIMKVIHSTPSADSPKGSLAASHVSKNDSAETETATQKRKRKSRQR